MLNHRYLGYGVLLYAQYYDVTHIDYEYLFIKSYYTPEIKGGNKDMGQGDLAIEQSIFKNLKG